MQCYNTLLLPLLPATAAPHILLQKNLCFSIRSLLTLHTTTPPALLPLSPLSAPFLFLNFFFLFRPPSISLLPSCTPSPSQILKPTTTTNDLLTQTQMHTQQQKVEDQLTLPEWLDRLLSENFFQPCSLHCNYKRNAKTVFCVDCHHSLCSKCILTHSPNSNPHRLLQIRRYIYHDVIRLDDAQKLLDCSHVQPYISNGSKVVFLNQRPTMRSNFHTGNICAACDRILQDPFLYCCISCKVDHILDNEGIVGLYGNLRRCDSLNLNDAVGVDIMTPDSVLEHSPSVLSSSNSNGCVTNAVVSNPIAFVSTATTATTDSGQEDLVFALRKKRTPKFEVIRVDPGLSNGSGGLRRCSSTSAKVHRRKRTPQRSALA